ncbi:FosX/FosE/FosI family fosfomycin resistance hydrolase [Synechococcus sp. PCC 6312]|uniref:FosX/FosE/FosI family fosfomycin resistance hydrolase n=1 Tax=Synechococcus sp. (strain ATCC 27167 / PCC 6312) TaxID=195253 RepID=UPI00029F1F58|nr:FosX/FosE/FosI family fosfomycin resistance hydrolase [Synechococcus sp. PCC 6312]AFY60779.1 lactoylglutathione lyase-like lyase [Synechococcus sp. PCC 6312]
MIEGISHITFIVRDLEQMATFLTHIFDAKEIYASGDKTFSLSREKFFLINHLWIAIMEGEPLPSRSYNHVAFKIREKDFEQYAERIRSLGVEVRSDRSRVEGEGQSLYFYDYDNHLFELHTGTLEERLERYSQSL